MARNFPDAEILATDIGSTQPCLVPSNYKPFIDDANDPWVWRGGSLDIVHIRGLSGGICDLEALMGDGMRCPADGGRLEICDLTLPKALNESEGCKASWFHLSGSIRVLGDAAGLSFDVMEEGQCREWMERADFEIVGMKRQQLPLILSLGSWATTKKEMGEGFLRVTMEKLEALELMERHGGPYIEV